MLAADDHHCGLFISFEGGEGSGKTTQIRALADHLARTGIDCLITREPGGSPGAEIIRDLVLRGAVDRWTPMTEALLLAASRAEHVARTIKPALAAGRWVLCDRFADSSIAYQGAARGVGVDKVAALQKLVLDGFTPDLTFFLDIAPEIGLARARAREAGRADAEDRFERMDISLHTALRQAFLDLAARESQRIILLNADQDIEALQAEIRARIEQKTGTFT